MSWYLFLTLLLALAAQRLYELDLSRRNEAKIHAAGGFELYPGHFQVMRLIHLAWFLSMLREAQFTQPGKTALLGAACLVAGQFLRLSAIRRLGWRWSVRILVVPGEKLVREGPYRWLRHPNYAGVCLEIFGVPLLHGAWRTSLAFTAVHAVLLAYRIRCEERALARYAA